VTGFIFLPDSSELKTEVRAGVQVYEKIIAPMSIVMQMSMMIPQPTDNLHQRLKALNTSAHGAAMVHKIHSPRFQPWV
jgi:hypothetical protein